MTQQQKDELNKELCKLLGICWHEWVENKGHDAEPLMCKKCWKYPEEVGQNPDFATPEGIVQLLGIMESREDYEDFGDLNLIFCTWDANNKKKFAVPIKYIVEEEGRQKIVNKVINFLSNRRDAAIEFLKSKAIIPNK